MLFAALILPNVTTHFATKKNFLSFLEMLIHEFSCRAPRGAAEKVRFITIERPVNSYGEICNRDAVHSFAHFSRYSDRRAGHSGKGGRGIRSGGLPDVPVNPICRPDLFLPAHVCIFSGITDSEEAGEFVFLGSAYEPFHMFRLRCRWESGTRTTTPQPSPPAGYFRPPPTPRRNS